MTATNMGTACAFLAAGCLTASLLATDTRWGPGLGIHQQPGRQPAALTAPLPTFTDISPRFSPRYAAEYGTGRWGVHAAGGRVNNLAGVRGSNQIYYAATEWGGLWKTLDGGDTWFQLAGHVPTAVWDVAVDPLDASIVYATSFYDGREDPVSGIQVSYDGGSTWRRPTIPFERDRCRTGGNSGMGADQVAPSEWSAFGIGIQPEAPQHVYVGTSCGLAISHDWGATWAVVDAHPNPYAPGRSYVWDVSVQPGGESGQGIVDVCGVEGHSRTVDGGKTWLLHTLPYPNYSTGRCSITASPDESYVLFVTDDRTSGDDPDLHQVYESDDAGRTWFKLGNPYPAYEGVPPAIRGTKRLTFVLTNKRSDAGGRQRFDLWYGENDIWRAPCVTSRYRTPARAGTTASTIRCPPAQTADGTLRWSGPPHWVEPFLPKKAGNPTTIERVGAHGDSGDLEFDLTASVDACPLLYASDGGVFVNRTDSDECQSPTRFQQPVSAPRALWLWGMAGANLPNGRVAMQFGVQDDGAWAAPDADLVPTWEDGGHPDSFSHVADEFRYLWHDPDGLKIAAPGTVPVVDSFVTRPKATRSDGTVVERTIRQVGFFTELDQFRDDSGHRQYVIVTSAIDLDDDGNVEGPGERAQVFVTENFGSLEGAVSLRWRSLGAPSDEPCGVRTSVDPASKRAVILVRARSCFGGEGRLYRYTGDRFIPWVLLSPASQLPRGIDAFAVDPTNADRLYVSNVCLGDCTDPDAEVQMMSSADGGRTWQRDAQLDDMMVGRGLVDPGRPTFKSLSRGKYLDPFRATFGRIAQPTLVAYDPYDRDVIVAGGQDSGVFLTTDGARTWHLVTNPLGPGLRPDLLGRPHIPRPYFAHFKHDWDGSVWIYLGTQGRGVWRLRVELPPRRTIR